MTAVEQAFSSRAEVRPYRVVEKVRESDVITSFLLAPADGSALLPFEAGQFLTFRFEGLSSQGPIWRNYSLSGSPGWTDRYRISVKREPASSPEYSAGVVSNHLHDKVEVGSLLWARGPEGRFVLDSRSGRPVVLLAAGVGLTPLLSMAHALAEGDRRRVTLVHCCENGSVRALGPEIAELAERSGMNVHVCYRTPGCHEVPGQDFHSTGVITRKLLQSLLPLDDYDFYLCGPSAFMQATFGHLMSLGVPEERVHYEFFGPATVLRKKVVEAPVEPEAEADLPAAADGDADVVDFSTSGISARWDSSCESLLDFAEMQGLSPAFSCRAGICNSCMCGLSEGEVDYVTEPLDMPPEGKVLICCAKPRGRVVLKI